MQISFHGAAQTVTGSKHLITLNSGNKILLDCGLFQGHGSDTDSLNRDFGFNPKDIDYLILSHAHIDHSGLIPRFVSQGFKGQILATPATYDLCKIMLLDSAKIQESDIKYVNKKRKNANKALFEPLYTIEDALTALTFFKKVKYSVVHQLFDGVTVSFEDAGHIIGSASVHLNIKEDGKQTTYYCPCHTKYQKLLSDNLVVLAKNVFLDKIQLMVAMIVVTVMVVIAASAPFAYALVVEQVPQAIAGYLGSAAGNWIMLLLVLNVGLSLVTLQLGASFYGYGVALDAVSREYVQALFALPAMQEWRAAGAAETESVPGTEKFRQPV